jgi:ATP-dependent protease ClpP protease subunit
MSKLFQLYGDNAQREKRPVNVVNAKAEGEAPTIYIYDIISADWGIGAMDVIAALAAIGDVPVLNVRIASPGGDVFESRAIMNALKRFKGKKIGHIDALCASAATSIALSCDEVAMASDAMYMIHNVQGGAFGEKADLRATADLMETVEQNIVQDYVAKTGKDEAEIIALMAAETWMTATQALENGFVDSVLDTQSAVKNTWNLSAYAKAPANLAAQAAPEPAAAPTTPQAEPDPEPEPAAEPEVVVNSMTQANRNRLALLQATS